MQPLRYGILEAYLRERICDGCQKTTWCIPVQPKLFILKRNFCTECFSLVSDKDYIKSAVLGTNEELISDGGIAGT